jgi:hypothetical protein
MKILSILLLTTVSAAAQSGYFPSCYRDITSDACGYELQRHRDMEYLRQGIDLDARMRRDDYEFFKWMDRTYGTELADDYPTYRRPRRR